MSYLERLLGSGHDSANTEDAQSNAADSDPKVQQLLALNRAAISITSELELDQVLQRIVDAVREMIGCRYAAIGVLGSDGFIERFPTSGVSDSERERIGAPPRGHGLLGIMLRAGHTLRVPDMSKDPRRVGFPPHHPPMTSLLGVPIFVQDKLVGDLYLTDKLDSIDFSEDDEWLVQMLSLHVSTALNNAALHREAQRGREAAELEQQRLLELEQMKDEFLSTAAHELRTPLTAVRMSAGLALEQIRLIADQGGIDKRIVSLMELVVEGSERMHSLVNDLLDLTRLEQGRIVLNMDDIDLREVVEASAVSTGPLFKSKGQTLKVHLPETLCFVRGDRQRLEQLVINLLSNANKYTPDGLAVEARVVRTAAECMVVVRDDGPGVPEGEEEHIFERFYRSSLHRNDRTSSTGLGLPIARTIAEMHGGRVWVEAAHGNGAIFTLALPLLT